MEIIKLKIEGFRGIKKAEIDLQTHSVFVGPNNVGKSTIIQALAILFGKERWFRLTEHDFYGSNPQEADRIHISAVLAGFHNNNPGNNPRWFQEGRGVELWLDKNTGEFCEQKNSDSDILCVEIGYSARFDKDELVVESLRYFKHPGITHDPFEVEPDKIPGALVDEIGFYWVPASRTFDKTFAFTSPVFRRFVHGETAGLPAQVILDERDRLREPSTKIEETPEMRDFVNDIDSELAKLLPEKPHLQFRLTSTDSESLLDALAPHYTYNTNCSLPAKRHGSGLLSLQTIVLLLHLIKLRNNEGKNSILAIEEPELHLQPGIQRRIVHQAKATATQTICTSHSARVASAFQPTTAYFLVKEEDATVSKPLLDTPLGQDAANHERKLFDDFRTPLIEALMHKYVLIPEGRTDFEWLMRLCELIECSEKYQVTDTPFSAIIGIIPTQDAKVVETYKRLLGRHTLLIPLVDGDRPGNDYKEDLIQCESAPVRILQWQDNWDMENVIQWILEPKSVEIFTAVNEMFPSDKQAANLSDLLEEQKGNYLLCENIIHEIKNHPECMERAEQVLNDLRDGITGATDQSPHLSLDEDNETVVRWTAST